MAPSIDDPHQRLAQACIAKEWSKAIKILSSLLSQQPDSVPLLCNRAFCHNKLELHKHAIKDCDKALRQNPAAFQAYIHKGNALVALGKHQDALQVWKQGYDAAINHPGNLELLLELHMLMMTIQNESPVVEKTDMVVDKTDMVVEKTDMVVDKTDMVVDKTDMVVANVPASVSTSCSPPKTPPRTSMQVDEHSKSSRREDGHSKSSRREDDHSKNSRREDNHNNSKLKRGSRLISLDLRLSRGIGLVNNGKYEQAVNIFDQVIKDNPNSIEALLGRGTAYAFQRDLEAAIVDFTQAIQVNPHTGEAWKRRGQARAALGSSAEAISDLSKALEFDPMSSDILHERGTVYFKSKDYEGAVKDLQSCVALDKSNKLAQNYLGLALLATGHHAEGIKAHYKAVELDPTFKEGWSQLAQSYSELGNIEKAMECLQKALSVDEKYVNAYRLLGLLRHGLGDHRGAVKELSAGLQLDPSNLECKYLRGSCRHALGEYADAVKDYDSVLDMDVDSNEKCTLQFLAFYQRVLALYTASKANYAFSWFDIDDDLHSKWKEAWCKRLRPTVVIASLCNQPPVKDSLKSGRLRGQDFVISKAKRILLETADQLGSKIQYSCPGFLRNKRQHRMAGLAALEIAQKALNTWKAMRDPWASSGDKVTGAKVGKRARRRENIGVISHNRGGVCSSSSSSSDSLLSCSCHEEKSSSGRLTLKWQDVYSIAVKWRQISEPCDPVVWVNKLSDKEFNAGFGSHTPMLLGQARVVRYYPNFSRAFPILKNLMLDRKCVYNASNEPVQFTRLEQFQAIEAAVTCSDLYNIVGEDFWVVTPCHSTAVEGKILEGTRLTMQKMGENSFDFSIRTPGTPLRWAEYDFEMSAAWEALCDTFCWEAYGSTDMKLLEKVRDCILKLTFYWYNFMPLARGTAAVGFVVLLGLFLAAGMEITTNIPEGVQVDWEAILSSEVKAFMQAVSPWMYRSVKSNVAWQNLPDVAATFPTTGSVVAALSTRE